MRRGFTLLELIVVVIILGILATLGFSQYVKMVEKGRTAESKAILGQLRSANAAYFQERGAYATNIADLAIDAPTTACQVTHYFSYTMGGTSVGTAIRCNVAAGGKTPSATNSYNVTLTAAGVWGGTAGYY